MFPKYQEDRDQCVKEKVNLEDYTLCTSHASMPCILILPFKKISQYQAMILLEHS